LTVPRKVEALICLALTLWAVFCFRQFREARAAKAETMGLTTVETSYDAFQDKERVLHQLTKKINQEVYG
jgi:hypothetical protein